MEEGDEALLARCAALLRLAEQLERSRDQLVHEARVDVQDGLVRLELVTGGDVSVARWAAQRQADLFESAFGRKLEIAAP
jgi:exopolyphosphatase / guanosine-5'-triphosphate,3'-diphosphate pyrophosphatase